MRVAACLASTLLGGCFLYDGDPAGPPRWPGDDLAECETTRTSYVIDAITVPIDADTAEPVGLDLDRDGTIDNKLGDVYRVLAEMNFDVQGRTDEALAADTLLIGLTLEECASPSYTLVELHRGVAIDRTVEPPTLTTDLTSDLAAVDRVADDRRLAVRGQGSFPSTALFEAEAAEWLPAYDLSVELAASDGAEIEGKLATGIEGVAFYDAAIPVIHRQILREIEGQPGCPLACEDEDLATLVGIFDENVDGEITLEEVTESRLLMALLDPDLDLLLREGTRTTYWPGQDDELDSISFGMGFHARVVQLAE